MVRFTLTIGEEERAAMRELSLQSKEMKKQKKSFRVLFSILAVLLAILAVLGHSMLDGILAAAALLIDIFGVTPIQRHLIRRYMKKVDPQMTSGERSYEIDEEGIHITTPIASGFNRWDAFKDWGALSHYTWIRRMDNQVILLDRDKMTPEEVDEVYGYLKNIREE